MPALPASAFTSEVGGSVRRRRRHHARTPQATTRASTATGSSAATARIRNAMLVLRMLPDSLSASPISLRLRWPEVVSKWIVTSWVSMRRRCCAASLLACSTPASISDSRVVIAIRSSIFRSLRSW
jgi:hypothetical protein